VLQWFLPYEVPDEGDKFLVTAASMILFLLQFRSLLKLVIAFK
jgi:hypothetical protein